VRYYQHHSRKARWSYRIAWMSVLLFLTVLVWHRFFSMPTPLALKLLGAAVAGAVMSLILSAAALVNIWKEGYLGAIRASFALLFSLFVLALPLRSLPNLLSLPRLYDVTTDPASPPAFDRVVQIRQGQANPAHYDPAFAALQAAAYPDIAPLQVPRSLADVYSAVRDVVSSLNWKVIDEQAPEAMKSGRIEASDRTFLFGFVDDVVIRVTGSQKSAKIDMRSSSRFGQHDLGRNAQRIRQFMAEFRSRLAQLEQAERMEQLEASRQAREGTQRHVQREGRQKGER
jgi:uncharacterized protein (DUF1499 family)